MGFILLQGSVDVHGVGCSDRRKRLVPKGGAAKGMPRYLLEPSSMLLLPEMGPELVFTTGPAAAREVAISNTQHVLETTIGRGSVASTFRGSERL